MVLVLVCLLPIVTVAICPEESLRFVLSDSPLNGWLGSLYGGYIVAGLLGVGGLVAHIFRRVEASIDWSSFEHTRLYRILNYIEDRIWLFLLVFLLGLTSLLTLILSIVG